MMDTRFHVWLCATVLAAVVGHARGDTDCSLFAGHVPTRGTSVLRFLPKSEAQMNSVVCYLDVHDELDVWNVANTPVRTVDVLVTPKQRKQILDYMRARGIRHVDFIRDLNRTVEEQMGSLTPNLKVEDGKLVWDNYNSLNKIHSWMEALQREHMEEMTITNQGTSSDGREMKGVIIKFTSSAPVIFVEAGIHGRDWISPASAAYMIERILKSERGDKVRNFQWHIFPIVNPGGYYHSWDFNRIWRKSARCEKDKYMGVDLDRNFPVGWGGPGSSGESYSQIYRGGYNKSESETTTLIQYMESLGSRIRIYVSLQAYGQMVLFPRGYTTTRVKNYANLMRAGIAAITAIRLVSGRNYVLGSIASETGRTSGITADYAHSKCVPYVFVLRLRDRSDGRRGFLLPASQIEAGAKEAFAAVKAIADYDTTASAEKPDGC